MITTTDLTADTYQTLAGRTLIAADAVPLFPLDGLHALLTVLDPAAAIGVYVTFGGGGCATITLEPGHPAVSSARSEDLLMY